jgi:hypothetical protein
MDKNKKIIIITTLAPPAFGGTPTMLGRYLRNFPDGTYCFVADPATKTIPHIGGIFPCKYYFFDGSELDGRRERFRIETGAVKKTAAAAANRRFGRLKHCARRAKYFLSDFIDLAKAVRGACTAGMKAVKAEKPTHILAVSDNGPSFIAAYLISKKTGVPYSIFLFDVYKGNCFSAPRRRVAAVMEKYIIKNAVNIFVAGEGIGGHYEKLYGKKCVIIHNSCDIPECAPISKKAADPMKIVYTGAYYWAQQDSIERFKNAVAKMPRTEFDLYSYDTALGQGGVSQEESLRIQREEADALLLPLSFDAGAHRDVVETAPTGKISEYLVSGVPIIVHAPAYAWISKYIRKNKAGIVVDDKSEASIAKAVDSLKNDSLREELVINAFALAQKNHDVKKNSWILYDAL